jgi:3-oxoacyl-[acyl-carrier-protein] synthase III
LGGLISKAITYTIEYVFILGVGSACAQHSISSQRLKELGAVVDPQAPSNRSSLVTEDALFLTAKDRLLTSSEQTAQLGKLAVERACQHAGVPVDAIGLLIGDSATPIQTTPSEGQRIACALGLKTPTYDITGAGIANILHIDTIRRWKAERVPDIAVLVSSNAPTHAVDFHSAVASLFADGASAVVVSKTKKSDTDFRVVSSDLTYDYKSYDAMTIEKLGGAIIHADFVSNVIVPRQVSVLETIAQLKKDSIAEVFLMLNPLGAAATIEHAVSLGFTRERILSLHESQGDMLGASSFFCLHHYQDQIPHGASVFLIASGGGSGFGYLQLAKEGQPC